MSNFDEWLKGILEENLGTFVEDAISSVKNLDSRSLEHVCEELYHTVCHSKEMSELRDKMLHHSSDVLNSEREPILVYDVSFCENRARGRSAQCASADASPRVEKTEEYLPLSDRRGRSCQHNAGQRLQALDLLLKVPVSDIVCSANWPQLQQELCESLRDDNWTVFSQVLKVLSRLSSSLSFSPVREGFLSLLEGLTLYYLTRHLQQQLPSAFHGIKFDNAVHRRLTLISHCVLQAFNEVPGKWIRYGEKRTQEIVDNFIDLLSMHTHHHRTLTADQSKDILYPFHIFSVLDPEANWCTSVMHAAFGRSILLKCVMKSVSLIRFIVEEMIIWLNGQMKLSDSVTAVYESGSNGNVNGNTINLTVFIHCISLIRLFVSCDKGHLIFPVLTSIQEEAVSMYNLLLKLLEFLNKVSDEPKTIHSKRLVRVLETACAALILSKGTRILHSSSLELIYLLVEGPTRAEIHALHAHNINILSKISESPTALRWMMGRPIRKTREGISRAFSELRVSLSSAGSTGRESALTNQAGCIARKIAMATVCAVKERNVCALDTVTPITQLLALSEKLFSSPEGYLVLESCEAQLISQAGHLFMYLTSMVYDPDPELLAVQQSCESFLISMTLTPMGFLAVSVVDGLLKCLVTSYLESPLTAKRKEPRFLHLLRLSTVVPDLKLQVCRKSLMKHALNQLWYSQNLKSDWMWHEAKQEFLGTVLCLCSTPQALSEMLEASEQEDCCSESTLVEQDEPLSLNELLERGLQGGEEYPSFFQEVAFDVLHCLAHNVDFVFILQQKLKLTECLQKLLHDAVRRESCSGLLTVQPSPRRDKVYISDDIARSCSHILTLVHQLKDSTGCNTLQWLKSPRSPRTHAHTSRPRVQTDLHRFLQDTRHGLHDSMWISHARRAFRTSCRSEIKIPVLIDLLDQILQSQPSLPSPETPYRWPSSVIFPAHSLQDIQAIEVTIRYGCQIKTLNVNMINQHVEQLSVLLHQAKVFLGLQSSTHCFDWFSSSVFLMCCGNLDRTRSILQRVAMLPNGPFIWPLLSQDTIQSRASVRQHLQGLIAEYVPKSYNALLDAGVPWWFLVDQLLHQAFIPAMSLSQLPHILALMALHSWEYSLYLQTSILVHIQPALLDLSLHRSIHSILSELKLDSFVLGDYLPFMDKVAKLNRPHLVRDRITTATL